MWSLPGGHQAVVGRWVFLCPQLGAAGLTIEPMVICLLSPMLPKTKIAPENQWLEDEISFRMA